MKKRKRKSTEYFTESYTYSTLEARKMMALLRRVYDLVEMNHLNDPKHFPTYSIAVPFPHKLGDDIFNYLQSKDQQFRDIVLRRQKNYRRRIKKQNKKK